MFFQYTVRRESAPPLHHPSPVTAGISGKKGIQRVLGWLLALLAAPAWATGPASGPHSGTARTFGRTATEPRNRSEVLARATAEPSPRSAVSRAMEKLGVSGAYALHVANQLESLHSGNGDALVQLNKATQSLAARWRAQGYGMRDVIQAFNEAAVQTKANAAQMAQVQTLVQGFVQHMTPAAPAPGEAAPSAVGMSLARPAFR